MKIIGIAFVAVLVAATAQAQDIPNAPSRKVDFALFAYDATARALDVTSTQHFLRVGGHEKELPPVISNHPAVMSLFEASVIVVEVYGAHELRKHGHPKLARLVPLIDGSACLATDVMNYRIGYAKPKGGK
jgi:hypothetical protein